MKGYKEIEMPEVVKLDKEGQTIEGEFISMEKSVKFEDSYAVSYKDTKDKKVKVVFVNGMAQKLFSVCVKGVLFVLEHAGSVDNASGTQKYFTYKLFIKE